MASVSRRAQSPYVLIVCLLLSVQAVISTGVGGNPPHAEFERQGVSSTSAVKELRQAIDELKALIRVADDIQDSIKKATVRHARLLRRAQLQLTTSASGGDTPPPISLWASWSAMSVTCIAGAGVARKEHGPWQGVW